MALTGGSNQPLGYVRGSNTTIGVTSLILNHLTIDSSMAKLYSTESAQEVIDEAVQIFGGMGVVSGVTVERLYREIRALRIYEGTSEIQKLVIAAQTMAK